MQTVADTLPPSTEVSPMGLMHLKRYLQRSVFVRNGQMKAQDFKAEWNLDKIFFSVIGAGIEQVIGYLYNSSPTIEQFEQWITEKNEGPIATETMHDFNALVVNLNNNIGTFVPENKLLNDSQLEFWNTNGYIIIPNAVPKEDCDAVIEAISKFLEIDINNPDTWYKAHPAKQGIMVQFFQHPTLQKNRRSEKIKRAFEQLHNTTLLWPNTDRVSFNPPEKGRWVFPGPYLHWDVSLSLPIPFGLQGLLYLSDTDENQGAFTLVPGFQHRIESWINSLPAGTDPRKENLYALGPKPIAARAGDFIIWHQALPHGSAPNTSKVPRIVQYINYLPVNAQYSDEWK